MGKKLNITGKGPLQRDKSRGSENSAGQYTTERKFLYSAISRFGSQDTMAFLKALGVPLKVEQGERGVPGQRPCVRYQCRPGAAAQALHVTLLRERAESLLVEEHAVQGVKTDRGIRRADAVILATGGVPIRPPAPPGKGTGWRRRRPHHHASAGSLVPLLEKGNLCARMQG